MELGSILNPNLFGSEVINLLNNAYMQKASYNDDNLSFQSKPFPHFIIKNFISDQDYLNKLRQELENIEYIKKDTDLYRFHQTKDLKSIGSPNLEKIKNVLYKDFKDILQKITNISLNNNIDLFAAKYKYNDVLLCHDDQSEGRRFAYIFYLNPGIWQESDGGLLGLFALNDHNEPDTLGTQIFPIWNQLVLFEVSDKSYHQVSELKTPNKNRLTLSGWFHGDKPLLLHLPSIHFPLDLNQPSFFEENGIFDWINPSYLSDETITQIQAKFCDTSEINLCQFLNEDKYSQLITALDALPNKCWENKGPRFRRSFLVIKPSCMMWPSKRNHITGGTIDSKVSPFDNPDKPVPQQVQDCQDTPPLKCIRECARLFGSEAMFLILANMTGLDLHPLATSDENDADTTQGNNNSDGDAFNAPRSSADRKKKRLNFKEASIENPVTTSTSLNEGVESPIEATVAIVEEAVDQESPSIETPITSLTSNSNSTNSAPLNVTDNENVKRPLPVADETTKDPSDYGTRFQFEIRKFRAGDYTLLNDTSNELTQKSLNLSLFLGCENWDPKYGGQMVYVDPNEEDPLLSINPYPNSLAIVYNDEGLAHFIKYINHRCLERKILRPSADNPTAVFDAAVEDAKNPERAFYQIFFNYFESPETRCD